MSARALQTVATTLSLLLVPAFAAAQAIFPTTPDWVSTDTRVSTGAALVDLDRDGWLDLVVANGNDMAMQPLAVYHNQGDGTLPPNPDWLSLDSAYNGHLDVADVNGDGWPDVAVAVLGAGSSTDHIVKVYLNNAGTLSSQPDWESNEIGNAFGCAFGDVNNDGRPDLAVATGWAYAPQLSYPNLVYVNQGGSLPATATWSSADTAHLQGVLWVDANRDGWLDLVGVASRSTSRAYLNQGGTLETTASWHATDVPNPDAIMGTAGDVDGDGYRDLFIADNNQLSGGSGRFRQYTGQQAGAFATTASWTYLDGYCSAVALADVDADGDLDLATGAWWDPARVFLNTGAGLPASPSWSSAGTSVVEKIAFGDVDRNGAASSTELFPASGRLYWLSHQPVEEVTAVVVDGTPLTAGQYVLGRELGWVTVGVEPGAQVEIRYRHSYSLDMAVSNWDDTVGNHLYYNRGQAPLFDDDFELGTADGWSSTVP